MVATTETINQVKTSTDKYKYGFSTEIEVDKSPKGLNEDIIRSLTTKTSKIPSEPTPIMKAKIDKENSEREVSEVELKEKD